MRLRRLLPLFAVSLALSACENPAARTSAEEIGGAWVRVDQPHSTVGLYDRLVFGPADHYERSLLIVDNAAFGELSASHVAEGEFRLRGDRLELRIARVTDWDEQKGEVVSTPARGWEDAGTVRISGSEMFRTYVTYPAGAPVSTTIGYVRPGVD